jgi:hypothetical protein
LQGFHARSVIFLRDDHENRLYRVGLHFRHRALGREVFVVVQLGGGRSPIHDATSACTGIKHAIEQLRTTAARSRDRYLEFVRDHQLEHQRVGRIGKAVANTELDAVRAAVVIDNEEQGLGLPLERRKLAHIAEIGVVLERAGPERREVVGDTLGRRKVQLAYSVKSGVDDGIDDEVPRP